MSPKKQNILKKTNINNDKEYRTYYNLYLYKLKKLDKLYLLRHLVREDAEKYANIWVSMGEAHDYILATEKSKPWLEKPTIVEKTFSWLANYQEGQED